MIKTATIVALTALSLLINFPTGYATEQAETEKPKFIKRSLDFGLSAKF